MTAKQGVPYRSADEPVIAPPPPPQLVIEWKDATAASRRRATARAILWVAVEFGVVTTLLPRSEIAAGIACVAVVVFEVSRRQRETDVGFTLDVREGVLRVRRSHEDKILKVALSSLRDVEVERQGIERRSDRQTFRAVAAPTELTGARDVARLTMTFDELPDARLTEDYAPVFQCMETFGKVRTFLRRHGWKPLSERTRA